MPDKEEKRIALRVDPEVWRAWDDKRHAERLSFQELGLRLFGEWFAGKEFTKENAPTPAPVKYNLHVVAQKSREVIGIMEKIVSDLELATGEQIVTSTPEVLQTIQDLAATLDDSTGVIDRNAAEIQEIHGKPGRGKRAADRSAPGRTA